MATSFLTGFTFRGDRIAWTTFRRKGKVWQEAGDGEEEIERPEPTEEGEEAPLSDLLKKMAGNLKGDRAIGFPADRALLRVVDLPAVEPDEIEGMVELQVDKFSPFPLEQMVVSHEVLHADDEQSRVLVVAARRDLVEDLGLPFVEAGMMIHRMDIDVLAWWHLLEEEEQVEPEGRHVVVLVTPSGTELVVSQDGHPVLFRTLEAREEPLDHWAAEVREEIAYTLTALDADRGGDPKMRASIWSEHPAEEALAAGLEQACGVAPDHHLLGKLPPLTVGLAQRAALAEEGVLVDLAPDEWHAREERIKTRKRLLVASVVLLAVWLAVVSVFLGALSLQQARLARLKERVDEVEGPAEQVRLIIDKVRDLEEFVDRTYSSIECLREVSTVLPRGIDLTSFVYKKSREVNLRGETPPEQVDLIYDFFQSLENSDMFTGIESERINTRGQGGRRKAQFTVQALLPGEEEGE